MDNQLQPMRSTSDERKPPLPRRHQSKVDYEREKENLELKLQQAENRAMEFERQCHSLSRSHRLAQQQCVELRNEAQFCKELLQQMAQQQAAMEKELETLRGLRAAVLFQQEENNVVSRRESGASNATSAAGKLTDPLLANTDQIHNPNMSDPPPPFVAFDPKEKENVPCSCGLM